jgi:hypothetical protein
LDQSEDYLLSTFLNLEPDDALWLQNPLSDYIEHTSEALPVSSIQATESGLGATSVAGSTVSNLLSDSTNTTPQPYDEQAESKSQCKPKAQKLDPELWERMFSVISNLFVSNKLDQMLQLLSKEYDFNPSRKQLKTRITSWQKEGRLPVKNFKKADMDYMVRVAHLRRKNDQVETQFRYHGFPVAQDKLQQHESRFGVQYSSETLHARPTHITWTSLPIASSKDQTKTELTPENFTSLPSSITRIGEKLDESIGTACQPPTSVSFNGLTDISSKRSPLESPTSPQPVFTTYQKTTPLDIGRQEPQQPLNKSFHFDFPLSAGQVIRAKGTTRSVPALAPSRFADYPTPRSFRSAVPKFDIQVPNIVSSKTQGKESCEESTIAAKGNESIIMSALRAGRSNEARGARTHSHIPEPTLPPLLSRVKKGDLTPAPTDSYILSSEPSTARSDVSSSASNTTPGEEASKCDWPGCRSDSPFVKQKYEYDQKMREYTGSLSCPVVFCVRQGAQSFSKWNELCVHLREAHTKEEASKCLLEDCAACPVPLNTLRIHACYHGLDSIDHSDRTDPCDYVVKELMVCGLIDTEAEIHKTRFCSPYPELLLELQPPKANQQQLFVRLKSLYADISRREVHMMDNDRDVTKGLWNVELKRTRWQNARFAFQKMLHLYADFFSASQNPKGSPMLRQLPTKYDMVARMWRHGCNAYLQLALKDRPLSSDPMLDFILDAIQIFKRLYRTIPGHRATFAEILGELHHRASEWLFDKKCGDSVLEWYSKAASLNPNKGSLYYRMAPLSRPHRLRSLYLYMRSFTSCRAFSPPRESIREVFEPASDNHFAETEPFIQEFLKLHALSFLYRTSDVRWQLNKYLKMLNGALCKLEAWTHALKRSAELAVIDIAALFDYGNNSILYFILDFARCCADPVKDELEPDITDIGSRPSPEDLGHKKQEQLLRRLITLRKNADLGEAANHADRLASDELKVQREHCKMVFGAFEELLKVRHAADVLPYLHIVTAFLVSLVTACLKIGVSVSWAIEPIFDAVPWESLCGYLNHLSASNEWKESEMTSVFPDSSNDMYMRPLPEDYMIRGQVWTANYFPAKWFDTAPQDLENCFSPDSISRSKRFNRMLWLGRQLAKHDSYLNITFSRGKFRPVRRPCHDLKLVVGTIETNFGMACPPMVIPYAASKSHHYRAGQEEGDTIQSLSPSRSPSPATPPQGTQLHRGSDNLVYEQANNPASDADAPYAGAGPTGSSGILDGHDPEDPRIFCGRHSNSWLFKYYSSTKSIKRTSVNLSDTANTPRSSTSSPSGRRLSSPPLSESESELSVNDEQGRTPIAKAGIESESPVTSGKSDARNNETNPSQFNFSKCSQPS